MTGDLPLPLGPIEVSLTKDTPKCGRCDRQAILSARVPHNWINAREEPVKGFAIIVLCPSCDIGHPEAGALIAWFTVHGEINSENLMQATRLIHTWASVTRVPPLDEGALEAEIQAWREGDL
ncbi:DUF6300 family protein [Planotetraspora sp. GP83]|uniref:DUF6300 family protein n=1 Tax=Planotetraspora sp. GP83 TaxID=3156264 RepID=UPI003518103E